MDYNTALNDMSQLVPVIPDAKDHALDTRILAVDKALEIWANRKSASALPMPTSLPPITKPFHSFVLTAVPETRYAAGHPGGFRRHHRPHKGETARLCPYGIHSQAANGEWKGGCVNHSLKRSPFRPLPVK